MLLLLDRRDYPRHIRTAIYDLGCHIRSIEGIIIGLLQVATIDDLRFLFLVFLIGYVVVVPLRTFLVLPHLLLHLLARLYVQLREVDFLQLGLPEDLLALAEELDLVAEELHVLEGVLDGIRLPARPALAALVVILQLKHLLNSGSDRGDDEPLDLSLEPRHFLADHGEGDSLGQPFSLLGSRHEGDDEGEAGNEGEGPKEDSEGQQSICHFDAFLFINY